MNEGAERVRQILSDLPAQSMPEHVAVGIHAAIAAEAEVRAGKPPGGAGTVPVSGPELMEKAAAVRAESETLRDDARKLVELVGQTERVVAVTMDELASQNPAHAGLLHELSQAAGRVAAQAKAA